MNCANMRTCAYRGHKMMVLDSWNWSYRECEPPDMTAETQAQFSMRTALALKL